MADVFQEPPGGGQRRERKSAAARAGLLFPVSRIERYLRMRCAKRRVAKKAAVYLAAALEYLVAEVLDISVEYVKQNKKKRMRPRDFFLAIKEDSEFAPLLRHVIIPGAGVRPHIMKELLPPATRPRE